MFFENGIMLNLRIDERECLGANFENYLTSTAMFRGCETVVEIQVPNRDEIQRACWAIRSRWDSREEFLRRLRANMACESGVCRNH